VNIATLFYELARDSRAFSVMSLYSFRMSLSSKTAGRDVS